MLSLVTHVRILVCYVYVKRRLIAICREGSELFELLVDVEDERARVLQPTVIVRCDRLSLRHGR